MAKAKSQKTVDVWKKKRWHRIVAPKLFNEQVIGETPAIEPDSIVGRTLKTSLMTLTRNVKKQYIDITFIVDRVMGDTGFTSVKKYETNPSWIKRAVRRDRNRIDDSFMAITVDGSVVRIKPFLLTRNLVPNSKCTSIINKTRKFIKDYLSRISYETMVKDLINAKLQKSVKENLKNIASLKTSEIRCMELIKKGEKKMEKPKEAEKSEAPKEKPAEKPKIKTEKTEAKKE